MRPDAERDDKSRDAVDDSTIARIVEQELGPLRQACVNELAARDDDDGAG